MIARMFLRTISRLWDGVEWVISRFVRVANTRLWCDHQWREMSAEEIGERYAWLVTRRCRVCGRLEHAEE